MTLETYLDEPPPAMRLMLVEPAAAAPGESLAALRGQPTPADVGLLVGPEGGWVEAEWTAARDRGVRLISLGDRTLRADAVPVAAISVLNFLWDEHRA
jgi:RsmE family RNA methyltransferase